MKLFSWFRKKEKPDMTLSEAVAYVASTPAGRGKSEGEVIQMLLDAAYAGEISIWGRCGKNAPLKTLPSRTNARVHVGSTAQADGDDG